MSSGVARFTDGVGGFSRKPGRELALIAISLRTRDLSEARSIAAHLAVASDGILCRQEGDPCRMSDNVVGKPTPMKGSTGARSGRRPVAELEGGADLGRDLVERGQRDPRHRRCGAGNCSGDRGRLLWRKMDHSSLASIYPALVSSSLPMMDWNENSSLSIVAGLRVHDVCTGRSRKIPLVPM